MVVLISPFLPGMVRVSEITEESLGALNETSTRLVESVCANEKVVAKKRTKGSKYFNGYLSWIFFSLCQKNTKLVPKLLDLTH